VKHQLAFEVEFVLLLNCTGELMVINLQQDLFIFV